MPASRRELEYQGTHDYHEIGVVARSLESYGAIIKTIFHQHCIPVSGRLEEPLAQAPLTKAVILLLNLPAKDFLRNHVIDLLSSPYFQFQNIEPRPNSVRPDLWDLATRELAICKGVGEWRRLRRYDYRDLELRQESDDDNPRKIRIRSTELMSIHKSKGLEFPIVILAGCHSGVEGGRGADAEALFDWSTGLTGVRIGQISDLAGLYIAEKSRLRTAEEQKRLLYVAMAAHGSGAVAHSGKMGGVVLNVDIGGGTSKFAICNNGKVEEVSAIDIGARLLAFDENGVVVRIEEAGRKHDTSAKTCRFV